MIFHFCRFNLHKHSAVATFVINVALADVLYCIFPLPVLGITFLTDGWYFGHTLCFIAGFLAYLTIFASWLGIAFISISRCFIICFPEAFSTIFSYGFSQIMVFILTWFFSLVILIPILTEVFTYILYIDILQDIRG